MYTDAATIQNRPPLPSYQATRIQEFAAYRSESLDITFQDGTSQALHLSIQRETAVYALTYDRTGTVLPAGPEVVTPGLRDRLEPLADNLKELRHELKNLGKDLEEHLKTSSEPNEIKGDVQDVLEAFREMRAAVNAFKKVLHRFLKTVDPEYADRYAAADPVEDGIRAFEQENAGIVVVQQSIRIELDGDFDPEYWSAENTAGRLFDFAVGLFAGGDRQEHAERMIRAMEIGYEEARDAFGGWLPPVARETLDLAADMLEDWAEAASQAQPDPPRPEGFEAVA